MTLWPKRKQWNAWSLPSKLTAISALVGILSLGFYLAEKSVGFIAWGSKSEIAPSMMPEIAVELEFPYERVGDSVRQNRRNPDLKITNRGSRPLVPLKVSVAFFVFDMGLGRVDSACYLRNRSHGKLIFESELIPGGSVLASLPGVQGWPLPVAYRIRIDEFSSGGKSFPPLEIVGFVDRGKVTLEHSGLSGSTTERIKTLISSFERKDVPTNKRLELYSVVGGVWIATPGPDTDLMLNDDGTISFR